MIRILALLAAALLAIAPSFSKAQEGAAEAKTPVDPERATAAEAMFSAMEMEKLLKESIEQGLDTQMEQFRQMGLPEEGVVELYKEMLAFMVETMDWEKLKPEFVRIYATAFTADEMKEIVAFYATPVGKKTISLTPKLMAEGMVIGQKKVEERQTELQQRITPILQKHMAPK
ncbi:MAG TPA: DUF2059 domain-containing protein [Bacteroidia bacterium]|nr:DUF2059 domain-containing protein [Bacteroidia bacterium]